MIRVAIADDHPEMRVALRLLLSMDKEIEIVCVTSNGQEAVDCVKRLQPDVLLTDIRMPGSSGIDLLREVRAAHPTLPVIVMTAHSDLPSAVSAYEGGAFEYLPKPFDIDQAVELVRRAGQTARRGDEVSIGERAAIIETPRDELPLTAHR
jgi:two-component system nitrogen regulation response regulator GlnG